MTSCPRVLSIQSIGMYSSPSKQRARQSTLRWWTTGLLPMTTMLFLINDTFTNEDKHAEYISAHSDSDSVPEKQISELSSASHWWPCRKLSRPPQDWRGLSSSFQVHTKKNNFHNFWKRNSTEQFDTNFGKMGQKTLGLFPKSRFCILCKFTTAKKKVGRAKWFKLQIGSEWAKESVEKEVYL